MSDELRKLAEAATPGPWRAWFSDTAFSIQTSGQEKCPLQAYIAKGSWWAENSATRPGEQQAKTNAAFIAAASPDVVLGLLDRIAGLEALNRSVQVNNGMLHATIDRMNRQVKDLRSPVEVARTNGAVNSIMTENIAIGKDRDEAYAAVRRLAAALKWMVDNDDTNEGDEPLDHLNGQSWNEVNEYWVEGLNGSRAALADPVVRRIVEGG